MIFGSFVVFVVFVSAAVGPFQSSQLSFRRQRKCGDAVIRRGRVEEAVLAEIDRVQRDGVTREELAKAKLQLRARLVFENDSVTNDMRNTRKLPTVATCGSHG